MLMVAEQLDRASGGEQVEKLFAQHSAPILSYASRRVGPIGAADVLSEVFVAATVALQRGNQVNAPWLMTVARNKVVDSWRRTERQDLLAERIRAEYPARRITESTTVEGDVERTLSLLRPEQRTILVQHYVERVPLADLAMERGISYSAMESAMARSRRAFRANHQSGQNPEQYRRGPER